MATAISAIRDALKANLSTVDGLKVHDITPPSIVDPAAIVQPDEGTFLTYDVAFGGGINDLRFTVRVLVSAADNRAAQDLLDQYLDPSNSLSIKAAVESDPDLGGLVSSVIVTEANTYGPTTYNDTAYYGVEFSVEVMS